MIIIIIILSSSLLWISFVDFNIYNDIQIIYIYKHSNTNTNNKFVTIY